ncbi:MAG TPA: hypothetical protein VGE83_08750, partial [Terracidiphilus sp.]
ATHQLVERRQIDRSGGKGSIRTARQVPCAAAHREEGSEIAGASAEACGAESIETAWRLPADAIPDSASGAVEAYAVGGASEVAEVGAGLEWVRQR